MPMRHSSSDRYMILQHFFDEKLCEPYGFVGSRGCSSSSGRYVDIP